MLLASLVVDRPRILICTCCFVSRLEDECLTNLPAAVLRLLMPIPLPALFLSWRRLSASLLGEVSESCLDVLAIFAGMRKLSCGADMAMDGLPHTGMFESALIISSPVPIEDARLCLENRLDHLDILFAS